MKRNEYTSKEKEYAKLFTLVFPSHNLKKLEVSYDLLDEDFKTKENNGQYVAIKPCPKVCTSKDGDSKYLYNKIGIEFLNLSDKSEFEYYWCPTYFGFHLTTKSFVP